LKQSIAFIISNDEIMPMVHLIWLESPQIASEAKPGQFFMVHCGEECLLRRPLSIHQVIDDAKIAFLFTIVGKGTYWLSQCRVGDSIDLLGPLGNSFYIAPASLNLLLVAGGIGIAPLHFLCQQGLYQGCSVRLLLGASTANQLYSKHLLPPEAELTVTTEDGSVGKKGMITDLLTDFAIWADQIFACGPVSMYHTIAIQKQELIKKPVQISLEVRMGCGLGVCYGCTVKTKNGLKQVCKDGPIFDLDDILWEELDYNDRVKEVI
jgi:dihydroorotate dehydrogenase electron transfer subunit